MAENSNAQFDFWTYLFMFLGAGAGALRLGKVLLKGKEGAGLYGLGNLGEPGERPQLKEFEVSSIEERLAILNDLIKSGRHDPDVILTTRKALSKRCGDTWCTPERDYDAEVIVIFEEAKKNVRYTLDSVDADTFVHSKWTLKSGGGDCDCMVVLLASMLGAVGYPTKFRVVQTNEAKENGEEWDHIYLLVGIPPMKPEKWVALDLSEPHPPGWEVPKELIARRADFDVT